MIDVTSGLLVHTVSVQSDSSGYVDTFDTAQSTEQGWETLGVI